MFNNLIKLSNGRTTTKILATLLVITLTFANFAMLGTFMLESIAIESSLGEQNNDTNSQYVNFNVYLDSNDTSVREVSEDINSEDLDLYVSVSVTGNGKLEKGSIDFSDSNFKSKENEKVFSRDIETISSQEGITIELPIVSRKDSSFNLNLLNMISKIKLTGEYVDENGSITNIDSTKEVKIDWTTQGITEEQIKVSQEIITNKIYEIDGENKRVLQLLIKTNVEDNKVPVKSTKIEIGNPVANVIPEEVKVSTYSTAATNGGNSIEFNNKQGSSWSYNANENKTYIELTNEAEGNVSWKKNATDEFIVTYVYDEQANIESISSDVNVLVVVYGDENTIIEQTNNLTLEAVEEKGSIVDIKSSVTKDIYKGYIYIGEETTYKTQYDIYVSYATANAIYVIDSGDTADTENLSTYYKSTLINKAQAINVLGNNGTIKIYNGENLQNPIAEIELSQENSEDYITFNYSENVNNIVIVTSNPVKEGKIEIINEKAIKVKTLEKIEEATKLDVATNLYVKDSEGKEIEKCAKEDVANLLEPTTSFKVSLDKETLSTQVENDLRLAVELITKDESNKLFVGTEQKPVEIDIELPTEIKDVTIENITEVIGNDEIKRTWELETNEAGNKVIAIKLTGEQKEYSQNSATITIDLKLQTEKFIANKTVNINAICINNEETVTSVENINLVSKSGLITKNKLTLDENVIEKINQKDLSANITKNTNANISTSIINNFGEKISNINIEGNIPEGVNLEGPISSNTQGVNIYYSEDLNSWVEEVADYSKIKAFKINLIEMENSSVIDLSYDIVTNIDNIDKDTALTNNLTINYEINNQKMKDNVSFTLNAIKKEQKDSVTGILTDTENLQINITATAGGEEVKDGEKINNGQVLRYKVKIKNISSEDLNNVNIKATIQNGVFYDLVEFAPLADETRDENGNLLYPNGRMTYIYDEAKDMEAKEFLAEKLKAGESKEFEYQVVAYIGEGENANQFNNNILIKADEIQDINVNDTKILKDASISIKLRFASNEDLEVYSKGRAKFAIEVTNLLNQELKNVNVKLELPEELDCDINDQIFMFDNENIVLNKDGKQVNILFKTIGANEQIRESIILKTNSIPLNELNKDITLKLTATVEGDENIYVSNDYTKTILQSQSHVETDITSDKIGQKLKDGDEITYIATIKNDGHKDLYTVLISDVLQKELKFISGKVIYSDGQEDELKENSENIIDKYIDIEKQDFVKIIIKAKVDLTNSTTKTISNKITIISENLDSDGTERLTNDVESETAGEEQDDEPPKQENKTNNISGLAWIDVNKNGIRDNGEDIIKAMKVILLNKEGKQIAETTTSLTGTYKFTNIEQGEYIVVFVYDTNKYGLTKYQVTEATEITNSDAISKEIQVNEKMLIAGVTDTIKIKGEDVSNIDIGLIENDKFDLSLNKYISKVIISNSKGTTTYEYNETQLAKVEISAKQIEGTTLLVEYEIEVSNEGEVDGYVTDIIDYLPKELEFNSEMNTGWYIGTDNYLHYMPLEPQAIEPEKTQTVKLVLTKLLKSNSTGTIDNVAEIEESSNLQGIVESDSIAGNKAIKEDDISTASLIVSIATGSPVIYIGIVIASMIILGLGIYIINKKVLKVNM